MPKTPIGARSTASCLTVITNPTITKSGLYKRQLHKVTTKLIGPSICLGELVRLHYVHTVLTTNFDTLVLKGIILTGILPVVADGIEALSRIASRPRVPQVVHLHGSMHTYSPRNSREAVKQTDRELPMQGTMYGVLKDCDLLVVIGYAGGEEGIVALLKSACLLFPNLVIYWILYGDTAVDLSADVHNFMSGVHKYIIYGQDADKLFAELMREIGSGVPAWMENPLLMLQTQYENIISNEHEVIRLAVDTFRDKLKHLSETPLTTETDNQTAVIATAVAASLSGKDERVVESLSEELEEQTPAGAQLLAVSLERLGTDRKDATLIKKSVQAWRQVLQQGSLNDGRAQRRLGETLLSLADVSADRTEALLQSAEAFSRAVGSLDADRDRLDWVDAQMGLATAITELGDGAEDALTRAIDALQKAVTKVNRDREPQRWANIEDKLGMTFLMRAGRNRREEDYRHAIHAHENAMTAIGQDETSTTHINVRRNLAGACKELGIFLKASSRDDEAADLLSRAGALYTEAGEAYRNVPSDTNRIEAMEAALATFEEAAKAYSELGDNRSAQVRNETTNELRRQISSLTATPEAKQPHGEGDAAESGRA